MTEDQRFEILMRKYFPSLPINKNAQGDYRNTHVAVAHAMYLWGITDGKNNPITREIANSSAPSSGWKVEIPGRAAHEQ